MLGLEPHVKLKRLGFLPRKLQPLYVKIRKNETYLERLLSYCELTSMLILQRHFVFSLISIVGAASCCEESGSHLEGAPTG